MNKGPVTELGKLVLFLSKTKEKFSRKEGASGSNFFVIKGPDVKTKKHIELVKRRMF